MTGRQMRRVPTRMSARQFAGSRTQSLAQVAGTLCTRPDFWDYLGVASEVEAAARVRELCGVASRSEFDTNAMAGQRFHDQVRRPFAATRES